MQQCIDSSNLDASVKLQDRFSSNRHGWYKWTFSNIKLNKKYKVLEIGCGNGALWSKNIDLLDKDINITLTDVCEDMVNNAKKNLSDYSDVFDFEIVDPNNIPFENSVCAFFLHFSTRFVFSSLSKLYQYAGNPYSSNFPLLSINSEFK